MGEGDFEGEGPRLPNPRLHVGQPPCARALLAFGASKLNQGSFQLSGVVVAFGSAMLLSSCRTSIRNRCYTIGTRDGSILPIKDVELLRGAAQKMALHHVDALLTSTVPARAEPHEEGAAAAADFVVSKYSAYFAKGAQSLQSISFKPASQRMSANMQNRADCTPRLLAQIDLHSGCRGGFKHRLHTMAAFFALWLQGRVLSISLTTFAD